MDDATKLEIEALQIQITATYQMIYRLQEREALIVKALSRHSLNLEKELKRLDGEIERRKIKVDHRR